MIIFFIILMLFIVYLGFQYYRNDKIFIIRTNWISTHDERYKKYTYDDMYKPNKLNWYGLRLPRDKDFV